MLKRLIIAAVGVVGLVVIGLGVASATVWRADDILVAGTSAGAHTLVTQPGVLELGGDPVTIHVQAAGKDTVTLAIGRDTDVAGWVGTEAYDQVTGLSGWHELAVTGVQDTTPTPSPTASDPAAAAPAPSPSAEATPDAEQTAADPAGSDLWVAQSTGAGSATLVWPQQEGRWSLIAVSTGASAPTLTLAWPREVTTPFLWPSVVVGLLLVLLSAWLLLRDVRRHRQGLDEEWHPVTTGAMPAVVLGDVDTIAVLTRRQMREAALAKTTRPAPRSGQVPRVPAAPAPTPEPVPALSASQSPPPATSRRALREQTSPTGIAAVAPVPPAVVTGTSAQAARNGVPAGATAWMPPPQPTRPDRPAPATTSPSQPSPANPAVPPTEPADGAHGRPSWAQTATTPPPAPAVPGRGATAWATLTETPPPVDPGPEPQEVDPGGAHPGRPAWLRTSTPSTASPSGLAENEVPGSGGSRADAWRRAWGLPPTEGEPADPTGPRPDAGPDDRNDHEREENR